MPSETTVKCYGCGHETTVKGIAPPPACLVCGCETYVKVAPDAE